MTTPLVSVVIPARNEERDIEACLEAVDAQDYPHDCLEVLVVDGGSEDRTADLASSALGRMSLRRAVVLRNEVGTTPSNLNTALAAATGEVLCRVDARSRIPPTYIRLCVEVLVSRPEVVVVGGRQKAVPPRDDAVGRGIAAGLNRRFATGLARYRRSATSSSTDTVYLGAFRRADLSAAGGWDERFPTNQDFELNRRLGRSGVVWFDARLDVEYVPRSSLSLLWRQYVRFGRWKVRYWRLTGDPPRPRQRLLLVAPALGVLGAWWTVRRVPPFVLGLLSLVGLSGLLAGVRPRPWRAVEQVPERAVATLVPAVVSAGWTVGVWSELARRRR